MFKYIRAKLLIGLNVCIAAQNVDSRVPIISPDSVDQIEVSVCGLTARNSEAINRTLESAFILKNPNEILHDFCRSNESSSRLVRWVDSSEFREIIVIDCKAFSNNNDFDVIACKETPEYVEKVKWTSSFNGNVWTSSKFLNSDELPSEIIHWNSKGLNGTYQSLVTTAEYLNGKLNGWVTDRHTTLDGDSLLWRFKFSNGILKYFMAITSNDNEDDDDLIMEGSCKNNICKLQSKYLQYGLKIAKSTKVICKDDQIFSCNTVLHGLMTAHLDGKLVRSECYLNDEIFPESECKK